jgi:beta-phosphoglucomutase family hydrolase
MNAQLAVIFDMDGVLVDSYRAHFLSWQEVMAARGRSMSREEFDATFGRTSREVIAALWPEDASSESEIARLDAQKEAAFRRILAADFSVMPGAIALLDSLDAAGFALAVGSSGPPENVNLVLDRLGKRSLFGAVVHGMDVSRGKPDPQVFLLAAQRLAIAPQRCAVVEDAALGIAAAKAAGMASVGLASTGRSRASLSAADLTIERLSELNPAAFRALIARHRGDSA